MIDRQNPIGSRHGMLVITHVDSPKCEAICDCGVVGMYYTSNILRGKTTSCGCNRGRSITKAKTKDLTGRRFGRLVVVAQKPTDVGDRIRWICYCDCGKRSEVLTTNLTKTSNSTKSCGCLARENVIKAATIHGQSATKAYKTFHQQKREAAKLHRTPRWADMELIRMFYEMCPDGMVVDHILPLQGTHISGLNVLGNLQYLTASENSRKRNKFTPYIERVSCLGKANCGSPSSQ